MTAWLTRQHESRFWLLRSFARVPPCGNGCDAPVASGSIIGSS